MVQVQLYGLQGDHRRYGTGFACMYWVDQARFWNCHLCVLLSTSSVYGADHCAIVLSKPATEAVHHVVQRIGLSLRRPSAR